MSDYTKNVDYSVKDGLTPGDPAKRIYGSELDAEFDEIETAVASKVEKANGVHTGTTTMENLTLSGNLTGVTIDGGTY